MCAARLQPRGLAVPGIFLAVPRQHKLVLLQVFFIAQRVVRQRLVLNIPDVSLQLRLLLPSFIEGIVAALIQDADLVFLQHLLQLLFCIHRLVPPHPDGPCNMLALQCADCTGKAAVEFGIFCVPILQALNGRMVRSGP